MIPNSEKTQLLPITDHKAVVLFDGVCNLCNGAVDFIIRHDREAKFIFASLQSEAGQQLLKQYNLPLDRYESFVLLKAGKLYQRSDAALEIAADLGRGLQLLKYFKFLPTSWRDTFYLFIARNRYRFFGKKESCRLPSPAERARFIG